MILFAGDPHGYFQPIVRAIRERRPDAVVLLGDYDLEQPLDKALGEAAGLCEIAWIHGNHDADRKNWYVNLFDSALGHANLNATVQTLGSLRVAGLGGVFRGQIWHPDLNSARPVYATRQAKADVTAKGNRWRDGPPIKHHASIWWEDYERLSEQTADVLVCHEAPSCHRRGYALIDELAKHLGARLIVHGHHHTDYTARLASGIEVIGVGLAGVTSEQGEVIAPGLDRTNHERLKSQHDRSVAS